MENLKFKDYKYERVNIKEYKEKVNEFVERLEKANETETQAIFEEYQKLYASAGTMSSLSSVRYTINTNDEFYAAENDFYDQNGPQLAEADDAFIKAIMKSSHLDYLKKVNGEFIFKKYELQLKTFNPIIMEDLVKENELVTKYDKLIASAKIEFEGKVRNLSQIAAFYSNKDRSLREKAWKAYFGFITEHEDEFNKIYDELVHVRHNIAIKLGYKNFVQLGYDRLGRTDYTSKDVKVYRDEIAKYVVPLCNEIYENQRKRLGLDKLYYYDINYKFDDGNPTPIGDKDFLVGKAKEMYGEISKETKEFFNFMVDHDLLDLVAKEGKQSGGYCTYFPDYKSPFIFSNFNGTAGDVDVLTHEAGHAFQVYSSSYIKLTDLTWPTLEACEIHSMSMEFFAEPYIDKFFGKDAKKYLYSHLAEALEFLPYGASIDEFQEWVYENVDATPAERLAKYSELEKKYLPVKDYKDNDILKRGGYWIRQGHVFGTAFYYIDYTLAQVCAFQYLIKDLKNHEKAWEDYYNICKIGGLYPFLEILKIGNVKNPFIKGTIKEVCEECVKILHDRAL